MDRKEKLTHKEERDREGGEGGRSTEEDLDLWRLEKNAPDVFRHFRRPGAVTGPPLSLLGGPSRRPGLPVERHVSALAKLRASSEAPMVILHRFCEQLLPLRVH